MTDSWTIYALCGEDLVVRYVGRTGCAMRERLNNHLQGAKKGMSPLHEWLRDQGQSVIMIELQRLQKTQYYFGDTAIAERKWVEHYVRQGNDLFNVNLIPRGPRIITLEDQKESEA